MENAAKRLCPLLRSYTFASKYFCVNGFLLDPVLFHIFHFRKREMLHSRSGNVNEPKSVRNAKRKWRRRGRSGRSDEKNERRRERKRGRKDARNEKRRGRKKTRRTKKDRRDDRDHGHVIGNEAGPGTGNDRVVGTVQVVAVEAEAETGWWWIDALLCCTVTFVLFLVVIWKESYSPSGTIVLPIL